MINRTIEALFHERTVFPTANTEARISPKKNAQTSSLCSKKRRSNSFAKEIKLIIAPIPRDNKNMKSIC